MGMGRWQYGQHADAGRGRHICFDFRQRCQGTGQESHDLAVRAGARPQLPMLQAICAATKDTADYFGWMDIPSVIALNALGHNPTSTQEGEMTPAMLAQLSQTLDAILALTPKEKTYIQWINGPNSPTEDVAGTIAYIAGCQQKGIDNFNLLMNVNSLQQDPWKGFYMSLAKRQHGRPMRRP